MSNNIIVVMITYSEMPSHATVYKKSKVLSQIPMINLTLPKNWSVHVRLMDMTVMNLSSLRIFWSAPKTII